MKLTVIYVFSERDGKHAGTITKDITGNYIVPTEGSHLNVKIDNLKLSGQVTKVMFNDFYNTDVCMQKIVIEVRT